jgi:hypothetical protein
MTTKFQHDKPWPLFATSVGFKNFMVEMNLPF